MSNLHIYKKYCKEIISIAHFENSLSHIFQQKNKISASSIGVLHISSGPQKTLFSESIVKNCFHWFAQRFANYLASIVVT
jgi:hypothetical protein